MCFRILILTLTVVSGRNIYLFNLHDHYATQPRVDYGNAHNSANGRQTPYGFQRREVNTPANFNSEPGVGQGHIYSRPRGTDHYSFSTEYHNRNFEHTSNVHETNFGTRSHQTFDYGSEDFNRHGGSDREDRENRNQFEFHSKSGFDNPNSDRTRINSEDNSRINENRRSLNEFANNQNHESGNRNAGTHLGNQYAPTRSQNIVIDKNSEFNNYSSVTRDTVPNNSSDIFVNRRSDVKKTTSDNEIVSKTTEKVQLSRENRTNSTEGVSVVKESKGNTIEDEGRWVWDSSNATSTTAAVDIGNRAVFSGDQCPTNMAKIGGKCVEVDTD